MTHHSELLNLIATAIDARTYLEIGVFTPAHNFDKIEVPLKFGVDPDPNAKANCRMTSDKFFKFMIATGGKIQLALIDGLHHSDQVKKDVENCWAILATGGVMVIHDANPHSERITHVPRDNREWCGDVYKTVCNITTAAKFTVDMDYGCCVIRKRNDQGGLYIMDREISWEDFDRLRVQYLHLVSTEEAGDEIARWKIERLMEKQYTGPGRNAEELTTKEDATK